METSDSPVLVTGATGNIGRIVIADLLAAGRRVRAADINPARAQELLDERVEVVRFDFTDSSTWDDAYAGVQEMFLMRPPALSNIKRDMAPSLEAARSSGVRHIVLLSLQGAEGNKVVPHAKIEAWLLNSGLRWTFVRPSFFMENLTTTHSSDIRERDEICVPAGAGRTSFVAAKDVAAVASAALIDPTVHLNKAWTPTGPEALTYHQIALILSDLLGRTITYTRPGIAKYIRHATKTLQLPIGMALVTTAIYTIARLGKADGVTGDVLAVTGRPPTSFDDWAVENAAAWTRD